MSRPLIYLDLDRTLYRTPEAGAAIWKKILELYPEIAVEDGHDRQREFYVHTDDAYAYDFAAHVAALGLEVSDVYQRLQESELADGRFEYDGVGRLLEWVKTRADVKILTYGIDDFQRFKVTLCPSLQGVPVEVTLRKKGDYLENVGAVWLVDDKALHDDLPDNVQFIQVLHGVGGPRAVSSLEELMLVLISKI